MFVSSRVTFVSTLLIIACAFNSNPTRYSPIHHVTLPFSRVLSASSSSSGTDVTTSTTTSTPPSTFLDCVKQAGMYVLGTLGAI